MLNANMRIFENRAIVPILSDFLSFAAMSTAPCVQKPYNTRMRSMQESVQRALDANFNRAGEALRVLEDVARFLFDDAGLTKSLKALRHKTAELRDLVLPALAVSFRDTVGDVGTTITEQRETQRVDTRQIISANFRRYAEAMRVIEEHIKLPDMQGSSIAETLRYESYTLEKLFLCRFFRNKLEGVRLMVLYTPPQHAVTPAELVEQFADLKGIAIQLRMKSANDSELLSTATELSTACKAAETPLIINDRPDICLLSGADGVHLGDKDLPVAAVRKIAGAFSLIGLSTHNDDDLVNLSNEVDYIGAGPCFASGTKSFKAFAGPEYAVRATQQSSVPVFAIGGIFLERAKQLARMGVKRVAASGAIFAGESPRKVAIEMLEALSK